MTHPVRLQLSRIKNFRLQIHSMSVNGLPAVNVARPSKWGNPFTVDKYREDGFKGDDTALSQRCAEAFRGLLMRASGNNYWDGDEMSYRRRLVLDNLSALRGKNLACWCALDACCHADVLLEIANREIG